jgi:hypothetical protein
MGDLGNLVLYMFDGILNRLKRLIYPFLSDNSLLTDTRKFQDKQNIYHITMGRSRDGGKKKNGSPSG